MSKVESFWCHEASNILCVRESDYARLEQEFADLAERYSRLKTGEDGITHRVIAERDAALKQVEGLREALQQIFDQYPNPDLSHVDYRVHACRCAENALQAVPCAPTK